MYYFSPYLSVLSYILFCFNHRKAIKSLSNKLKRSSLLVTFEILKLAILKKIQPRYYWLFQLWKKTNQKTAHLYLHQQHLRPCVKHWSKSEKTKVLEDKIAFFKFCTANELPTPKILYIKNDNNKLEFSRLQQDLIMKRQKGSKGKGLIAWNYDVNEDAFSVFNQEKKYSYLDVIKFLEKTEQSDKNTYFLQERLYDHSALVDLGNGTLSTIRIISMIDEQGKIELFRPFLSVPTGKKVLNDWGNFGIIIPIDIETGKLGKGFNSNFVQDDFSTHPNKAIFFEGQVLPHWTQLKQTICKAHELLLEIPMIGWDVAITSNGVSLLEGNIGFSLEIHQRPPHTPLINSRLGDLLIHHLNKFTEK